MEYRIGMLGYGSMGRAHHYALDCHRHFYPDSPFFGKLVRVCAQSEKSKGTVEARGVQFTLCEDDILCADDIDIVDICTPNIYHYESAKKALQAKKHIYCEKPLCVTALQAEELAALAKEAGVTAQVVFNTRFLPPIRRAKQLCESGALGRIISFRCAYLHASCTDLSRPVGWKQDRKICGGGVWFDLGSHAVDLIYHLCGPIRSVEGRAQIAHAVRTGSDGTKRHTNADEAFYAFVTLQNGACGTVEANKLATGTNDDLTLEIYGERGALRFSLMEPNWLYFYDATKPSGDYGGERGFTRIECVGRFPCETYPIGGQKAPIGWLRGHVESYYAFLKNLHEGKEGSPSFADGAHIQWALEAGYRSARL